MLLALAEALDVPLRARNEILLAAGFAPIYPERALTAPEMALANQVLDRILAHHEPYPAMVIDGGWDILVHNRATARIIAHCVPGAALARYRKHGKLNFVRLMCAPDGLKPHVRGWARTGAVLLARLRREAAAYPGSPSALLLRELLDARAFPDFVELADAPLDAVIPLTIEVNGEELRLLNTLTTFGTPQDVTLQELRIELSFPADEATERLLRSL